MLFILGSRSPRRRELLQSVVGADRLQVQAPANSEEEGFDGLSDRESIRERLLRIVQTKTDNVVACLADEAPMAPSSPACLITADTIVVAEDRQQGTVVLGQPRAEDWQSEVKDWMLRLYSGTSHEVWTGFQIVCGQQSCQQIVTSTVHFCPLTEALVDGYLATEESIGKAGGYAIQGAAAAFVNRIEGSLSNIIGLPVMEVVQALDALGIPLNFTADRSP